jgi:D-alanyl-D-alanine carboxypeptidase/D-alanyl-D-alanine-endopeptidase (penicillin-binding protein 4)
VKASGVALIAIALSMSQLAGARGTGSASAGSDDDDEDSGSATGSANAAPHDARSRLPWLHERIRAAISSRPALAKEKLGIAIVDLVTGDELYSKDADVGLNLASNTKLLTTVAALGVLGSGFHWRTAVYSDKLDEATGVVDGDLYVRGRGDPELSQRDLRELAADVAARGIRTVTGKLVVDGSYFDAQVEPPHYDEEPNERAGFRAPVASFGVGRSAVTVVVVAEPGGGAAQVRLEPDAGDYVRITKREVTTVTTGHTRISVASKPRGDHVEIEVTGQIRAADGDYELRRRVDDPARFAGEVFRKALAERGVTIKHGGVTAGAVPTGAREVASHDSAELASVIRDMNKYSDNYIAESVLKTLGAETRAGGGPGTWADGQNAVKAYLGKLGVTGYRADNGSGLFGSTSVSPHQLVTLLRAAHADFKMFPDLLASLPIGGVDGTLAKRWHGRAALGRVRAKTGTLDQVISLSGYVGMDAGHLIAFAIVENDMPGSQRGAARSLADEIVDDLLAYVK